MSDDFRLGDYQANNYINYKEFEEVILRIAQLSDGTIDYEQYKVSVETNLLDSPTETEIEIIRKKFDVNFEVGTADCMFLKTQIVVKFKDLDHLTKRYNVVQDKIFTRQSNLKRILHTNIKDRYVRMQESKDDFEYNDESIPIGYRNEQIICVWIQKEVST